MAPYYFIEGFSRAKDALNVARKNYPGSPGGRKAQDELVRYYELVVEEIAIIRTEMSLKDSYDYIGEWKKRNAELLPIRERWEKWIQSGKVREQRAPSSPDYQRRTV